MTEREEKLAKKVVIEELERIVELAKSLRYSDKFDVVTDRLQQLKKN